MQTGPVLSKNEGESWNETQPRRLACSSDLYRTAHLNSFGSLHARRISTTPRLQLHQTDHSHDEPALELLPNLDLPPPLVLCLPDIEARERRRDREPD